MTLKIAVMRITLSEKTESGKHHRSIIGFGLVVDISFCFNLLSADAISVTDCIFGEDR